MKYVARIVVIVLMLVAMIIPAFRPDTGIKNLKEFKHLRGQVETLNNKASDAQNQISIDRKAINEKKGDSNINLDNAKELSDKVSTLPGVDKATSEVIKFDGENITVVGPLSKDNTQGVIPGVQITVTVKDINKFLAALKELDTPYLSVNIVYPENKVVVRYNTQGGFSGEHSNS